MQVGRHVIGVVLKQALEAAVGVRILAGTNVIHGQAVLQKRVVGIVGQHLQDALSACLARILGHEPPPFAWVIIATTGTVGTSVSTGRGVPGGVANAGGGRAGGQARRSMEAWTPRIGRWSAQRRSVWE